MLATAMVLWTSTGALSRLEPRWPAAISGLLAFLLSLGLSVSLVLGQRFVVVAVHGRSMQPSLQDGDWVLVRRSQTPVSGQVVVVEHPNLADLRLPNGVPASVAVIPERRWVVKRVAAVPGDAVPRNAVPALAGVPEHTVPPGKLVLLGDNQQASLDSRSLGDFPADQLLGVVVRPMMIRRRPAQHGDTSS
jgi:signal peptidase I